MSKKNKLAALPSLNDLTIQDDVQDLIQLHGRDLIISICRQLIDNKRQLFLAGDHTVLKESKEENSGLLIDALQKDVANHVKRGLKKVINGTGTVLHTNLGRSNLSSQVIDHLNTIATGYSNLEYRLSEGKRGSRYDHTVALLRELTGAEDALIVNNNAAAVLLTLDTMAKEKEVIVSRGELVEIGGSFRIPSVIEASGCLLKEVGTTNKTHLYDYEEALSENTGAILKVHTSNFKVVGFTESVASEKLSQFSQNLGVPYIEDLGSGLLINLTPYGFQHEPTVKDVIENGADVVTFSGDKILGGPQAGIIVGKKKYIEQMKRNQLTRALRVDKMVLAALEGTLALYRDDKNALNKIPTLQMLTMSKEATDLRASGYLSELSNLDTNCLFTVKDDFSQVGGGSYPGHTIPTTVIGVSSPELSVNKIEKSLREWEVPVVGRIKDDEFLLDVRTISESDFMFVKLAFKGISIFN